MDKWHFVTYKFSCHTCTNHYGGPLRETFLVCEKLNINIRWKSTDWDFFSPCDKNEQFIKGYKGTLIWKWIKKLRIFFRQKYSMLGNLSFLHIHYHEVSNSLWLLLAQLHQFFLAFVLFWSEHFFFKEWPSFKAKDGSSYFSHPLIVSPFSELRRFLTALNTT